MTIVTEKINSQHDNLIEVIEAEIGGIKQQVVNARDLHSFLQVGKRFASWIQERIAKYEFVENEDFILISQNGEIKEEAISQNRKIGRGGDRRSIEYHITLDMAKELSMVENNAKGREARRYFIRCEKMAYEVMKSQFLLEPQTLVKKTTKDNPWSLYGWFVFGGSYTGC